MRPVGRDELFFCPIPTPSTYRYGALFFTLLCLTGKAPSSAAFQRQRAARGRSDLQPPWLYQTSGLWPKLQFAVGCSNVAACFPSPVFNVRSSLMKSAGYNNVEDGVFSPMDRAISATN